MGLDYEDDEDAATDELLNEDCIEARAARQLAVEDILAKTILALNRLAETTQNDGIGTENILDILLEAVIDSTEGDVYGTAFTNVFDRVRSLTEFYQIEPPDDAYDP